MRGALAAQPFVAGSGGGPFPGFAFVRGGVGEDVPEDAFEPGPVDRGPARNCLLVGLAGRVRLVGTRNRLSLPDRTIRKSRVSRAASGWPCRPGPRRGRTRGLPRVCCRTRRRA